MDRERKTGFKFNKLLNLGFCIGILFYIVSIVWFNFNGEAFYIFDVYSDALVAKYMAEEATLFPSRWVFGNQYYVVATPVVAALVYALCHNTVLSLSIASCIMTLLIIASFIWCCKPFFRRDSLIVGLFCIIGAVIVGNGICTYKEGLQFLYTLASFYACYVIGFLFTIGAYYRIKNDLISTNHSYIIYILAILLNVALGMQSLRQLLILNIPLVGVELLSIGWAKVRKREFKSKKALYFVLVMFSAEIFGQWFVGLFDKNTAPLISGLSLVGSFAEFKLKFQIAIGNLKAINGLVFLNQGTTWVPLGLIGVFFVLCALFAFFKIMFFKDASVPAQLFVFSLLSIACVFFVGITVFVSESRYFFIRHVAVAFAFMYLAESIPDKIWKKLLLSILLMCGAVNLFFNVYPDYVKVNPLEYLYEQVGDDLEEQGIDCVLVDWLTHPTVAACSDDEIVCVTFYPEFESYIETGVLLKPVRYLRPIDVVDNLNSSKSAIIINDYHTPYMPSFFDQLNESAPNDYMELFKQHLTLMKTYDHELVSIYVYTFDTADIIS